MSRNIEQELHKLLLDLSPNHGSEDLVDQASVVADASAIFGDIVRTASASDLSNKRWKEAKMLDSLLEAMQEQYVPDEDYEESDVIEASGLSPEQIIHKASRLAVNQHPSDEYDDPFGSNMSILNDDDLEPFYNNSTDNKTMNDYEIDDMTFLHPSNVFVPKGWGKHKSDSHSR